jgi:hypothetical protein
MVKNNRLSNCINIAYWCVLSLLLFHFNSFAYSTVYVDTVGDDTYGNGTRLNPYKTIQRGLDSASNGDKIVVMPGTYTGDGNRNITFKGKAVTLQSVDPDSVKYIKTTIIDAQGHGVIVRFVNDEGSATVFAGFSLKLGDTTKLVLRGVPGFCEFSQRARPTTRRLAVLQNPISATPITTRVDKDNLSIQTAMQAALPTSPDGYPKRCWNGYNPFYQPCATTNYYGSGDINLDGAVTSADVSLVQSMANGTIAKQPQADVDGNGNVTSSDVALISSAVSGARLPAWWNNLTTVQDRNTWVDKIMAIDKTNEFLYQVGGWVCMQYAIQLFIHCAYYRADLFHTWYNGGQTRFNIPLYYVSVPGHSINCILIGDDPTVFTSWRFIEPQDDHTPVPGEVSIPYGDITLEGVQQLGRNGFSNKPLITFNVQPSDGGGYSWTYTLNNTSFIANRPSPPSPQSPSNEIDVYHPFIINQSTPQIVFERMRSDLKGTTDIHRANISMQAGVSQLDPSTGISLTNEDFMTRLCDIAQDNAGYCHLIWKDRGDRVFGVNYGKYDPGTCQLSNISKANNADQQFAVIDARIAVSPDGTINVFWTTLDGIYWTARNGSAWTTAIKIADVDVSLLESFANAEFQGYKNTELYLFDVVAKSDNSLVLLCTNHDGQLNEMRYNGSWITTSQLESSGVLGADIVSDSYERIHAIYWKDGVLYHRMCTGASWTGPTTVSSAGTPRCARIAAGAAGSVFCVWEQMNVDHYVPAWSFRQSGSWSPISMFPVRAKAEAWYPTVSVLANGSAVFAWSARCTERLTIETAVAQMPSMFAFKYNGKEKMLDQSNGTVLITGYETSGTPSGLKFGSAVGVTTNGNLVRTSSRTGYGAWLDTPANLTGGLIFRSFDNIVQAHISSSGVFTVRNAIATAQ